MTTNFIKGAGMALLIGFATLSGASSAHAAVDWKAKFSQAKKGKEKLCVATASQKNSWEDKYNAVKGCPKADVPTKADVPAETPPGNTTTKPRKHKCVKKDGTHTMTEAISNKEWRKLRKDGTCPGKAPADNDKEEKCEGKENCPCIDGECLGGLECVGENPGTCLPFCDKEAEEVRQDDGSCKPIVANSCEPTVVITLSGAVDTCEQVQDAEEGSVLYDLVSCVSKEMCVELHGDTDNSGNGDGYPWWYILIGGLCGWLIGLGAGIAGYYLYLRSKKEEEDKKPEGESSKKEEEEGKKPEGESPEKEAEEPQPKTEEKVGKPQPKAEVNTSALTQAERSGSLIDPTDS